MLYRTIEEYGRQQDYNMLGNSKYGRFARFTSITSKNNVSNVSIGNIANDGRKKSINSLDKHTVYEQTKE